jgi:hypothetical protein
MRVDHETLEKEYQKLLYLADTLEGTGTELLCLPDDSATDVPVLPEWFKFKLNHLAATVKTCGFLIDGMTGNAERVKNYFEANNVVINN